MSGRTRRGRSGCWLAPPKDVCTRMARVTSGEGWACGFCGAGTADDPRWVQVRLTWTHSDVGQTLAAHHACLVNALEPGFPMAVDGPYE